MSAPVRVKLEHRTRYEYDREVWLSPHELRLRPAAHARTPIEAYVLEVTPAAHDLKWQQDPYGNWVARVVFPAPARELGIDVELVAELPVINPFDFYVAESALTFPFAYSADDRHALTPCLDLEPAGPRFTAWLEDMRQRLLGSPIGTIDFLVAVNRRVADDVRYLQRMEPGIQTCEQTLEEGSGSCRDSTWLLAQVLRHSGLASRFVSGYLVQLGEDARDGDGPRPRAAKDSLALHAWCEAYVPGAGWIGLDPTSGLLATAGHIPLACAAIPAAAAAVTGCAERAQSRLTVEMHATRIAARYYEPYREEVERRVRAGIAAGRSVLHLSSHSFTPALDGVTRDCDVGLLYDPGRRSERSLCEAWGATLAARIAPLRVRRNYPYRGYNDGLTTFLRKRFRADAYLGVEIEVNQKHALRGGRGWQSLRKNIVRSLVDLLEAHR